MKNQGSKLWHVCLYFQIENTPGLATKLLFLEELFSASFVAFEGEYAFISFLREHYGIQLDLKKKNQFSHFLLSLHISGVKKEYLVDENPLDFLLTFLHMLFQKGEWKVNSALFDSKKEELLRMFELEKKQSAYLSFSTFLKNIMEKDVFLRFINNDEHTVLSLKEEDLNELFFHIMHSLVSYKVHGFTISEKQKILQMLPKCIKRIPVCIYENAHAFNDIMQKYSIPNSSFAMGFQILSNKSRIFKDFFSYYLRSDQTFFFQKLREERGYFYDFDLLYYPFYSFLIVEFPVSIRVKEKIRDAVLSFLKEPEKECGKEIFHHVKKEYLTRHASVFESEEETISFEQNEAFSENPYTKETLLTEIKAITLQDILETLKSMKYLGSSFVEGKYA